MSEGFLLPKRETDFEGPAQLGRPSSISPTTRQGALNTSELLYSSGVRTSSPGVRTYSSPVTYAARPVLSAEYGRPVISPSRVPSARISPSRVPPGVVYSADYGRPVDGLASAYPVEYVSYARPVTRGPSYVSPTRVQTYVEPSPPLIRRSPPLINRPDPEPVARAKPAATAATYAARPPSPPMPARTASPMIAPRAPSPAVRTVTPTSTRPASPRIMQSAVSSPRVAAQTEVFSVYQERRTVEVAPVAVRAAPPAPPPQQAAPPPLPQPEPEPSRGRNELFPLPYFGVKKEEVNSPLDWGPYENYGGTRSWPGGRFNRPEGKEMTAFYYSPIGEKREIKVVAREKVASLRERIFREISEGLNLQQLEDDVDERFAAAFVAPPFKQVPLRDVKDVDAPSSLPGDPHYGRPQAPDLESRQTDRVLRKHAPYVGRYVPPQRCPKRWQELELYVGAAKIYDEEVQFLRSINTGAPPHSRPCTIEDYNIGEGTVIKPEYKQFAFEIKDKNAKQDVQKLGPLPTLDTLADRVWGGLDPDFWAGTVEQAPRLLAEFFMPPGGEIDGSCGSNCERDGMPHIGKLLPADRAPPRPSAAQPRVFGSERRAAPAPMRQPTMQTTTV